MTGETLAWHRLADRLKMSLQRCQAETTSREFVRWMKYMEWDDVQGFHRADHHTALLATLIRQFMEGFSNNPRKVNMEDFLLKFTTGSGDSKSSWSGSPPAAGNKSNWSPEERAAWSKFCWFSALGINEKGEPLPNLKVGKDPPGKPGRRE